MTCGCTTRGKWRGTDKVNKLAEILTSEPPKDWNNDIIRLLISVVFEAYSSNAKSRLSLTALEIWKFSGNRAFSFVFSLS